MPWSPLGQGFLTGKIDASTDIRKLRLPHRVPAVHAGSHARRIRRWWTLLQRVSERKQATPAQIALAWLLAQKPFIVPIPSTTKLRRLEENIGAAAVELTAEDLDDIEAALSGITVQGDRYPAHLQARVGR